MPESSKVDTRGSRAGRHANREWRALAIKPHPRVTNAMLSGDTGIFDFSAARTVIDVGSGDGELLSRVLHDWDDEQHRTILATCARIMTAHAELLAGLESFRMAAISAGQDAAAVNHGNHRATCRAGVHLWRPW